MYCKVKLTYLKGRAKWLTLKGYPSNDYLLSLKCDRLLKSAYLYVFENGSLAGVHTIR